jgi:uncharacterized membrane protein YfhO
MNNAIALSSEFPHVYNYQLFNICRIFTEKIEISKAMRQNIQQAGLTITDIPNTKNVAITPTIPLKTEGSLSFQSVENSVHLKKTDGMLKEWFTVESRAEIRTLIFARTFYLGYQAFLNGKEIQVTDYKKTLVRIDLPANSSGELHLKYTPVSWKYTKWSLLLGLLLMSATAFQLNRRRQPTCASRQP